MTKLTPVRLICLAAALCLSGLPAGCQSGGGDLATRAAAELSRASRPVANAPLPPGVPADLLAPAPATPEERATLAEVIAALPVPAPSPDAPAPNPTEESTRLYITGRAALLDGDADRAVELFEQAVEADPGAAAAWRDLGEAQLAAGERFAADAAHRKALTIDPHERRSLLRVGLDAASRRDFRRAVELLSRLDVEAVPGDPAEHYLVWSALGQSLIETGYLAAGVDLMSRGADLPDRFSRPTHFPSELEELYRMRSDSWREIGDAYSRLSEPDRALHAYRRAAAYPSFDPAGLLARRVYALLSTGRPAAAAEELLDAIVGDTLRIDDRKIALVGYLRRASRIGGEFEREFTRRIAALPAGSTRGLESAIALTRAAALPADAAAGVLRQRLAQAPGDADAIRELLARTGAKTPAALARQIATLIEANPVYERLYTRTALRLAPDAASLLASIDPATASRSERLLRARLLMSTGRDEEAETTLHELVAQDRAFTPAVSVLAELLLDQRRFDEASAVIDELDVSAGEPALLAKAGGLAGVGRVDEALALLESAADSPGASSRVAFDLGTLYEQLGRPQRAAERYVQARDADPQNEEAHAALIRLYSAGGALANREHLFQAVRVLRENIPSARTLRWLRAQELASSGQYVAAERALRELAEEQDDPAVERALVSVWIATSSAATAEAWLRERLARRPGDTGLLIQLARSVAAQGRNQDAADLLRAELDRRPGNQAVSVQLESLLRDKLGKPGEADELTMRRLEHAPESVGTALQRAAVLVRREQFDQAGDTLVRAISRAPALRPQELRAVLGFAQRLGAQSQTKPELRSVALALLDAVADHGTPLPEPAHRLRVVLLILDGAKIDTITKAIRDAYAQLDATANTTAGVAGQSLAQEGRPADAAAVLETAFSLSAATDPQLVGLWLSAVAQSGDTAAAERLLNLLTERRAALQIYQTTLNSPSPTVQTEEAAAGEIAYVLAQQFGARGDEEGARAMYRATLRFEPDHTMANNNLGYQLLEEGTDLARAEALIERAYAGDPGSPAVIDSLGWVRYHRGVVEDEKDPAGEIIREGAVTLLERAVRIALEQNDPGLFELRLHLGDALWRSGRADDARAQWLAGSDDADKIIARLDGATPEAITAVLDSLRARLDALADGNTPPVSPIADEPTTTEEVR